jgi:Domain of unknown function (4846)
MIREKFSKKSMDFFQCQLLVDTMKIILVISGLLLQYSCDRKESSTADKLLVAASANTEYKRIADIVTPDGFIRVIAGPGSFGAWLRNFSLKKDKTVYLYNGLQKENQSAQFAVLDIPVGNKDLQQCADAVMRLRAEYLFAGKRFTEIEFRDNNDKAYIWQGGNKRPAFEQYLENVFGWCGSASLEKQLKPVQYLQDIQSGDVFIRGGFPGHAMIVIDVAGNKEGKKIFMLAQSYMPAQDIHVVQNPMNKKLSPWYEVNDGEEIITPEWKFAGNQLRRW